MLMINTMPQTLKRFLISQKTSAFLLATSGTVLEYYEYALYGFFAPLFVKDFFPDTDPSVALLKIFTIFFLGSLAKPLGSLIFGTIGDRWDTYCALRLSILGMTLATFVIGILPTHAEWGSWAAFCLLLARLLQGMSVIGESDSMQIFIYEKFGPERSCLVNSLCSMSWKIGITLASVACAWVMQQSEPLSCYRWPFIGGSLCGLLIFWKRQFLVEKNSTLVSSSTQCYAAKGMMTLIFKNKKIIFATLLLCGSVGGCYHFYLVFLNHYCQQFPELFHSTYHLVSPYFLLIYTASSVIGALIADRIGCLRLMRVTSYSVFLLALLNVLAIINGHLPFMLMAATVAALAIFQAPIFVSLFACVTTAERCRTVFLGHAMGSVLFSGSTPAVSLWLWQCTQIACMPFVYFVFLVGMGWVGVFLLQHIYAESL